MIVARRTSSGEKAMQTPSLPDVIGGVLSSGVAYFTIVYVLNRCLCVRLSRREMIDLWNGPIQRRPMGTQGPVATHCILVDENGDTYAFGRNDNGQLGLGDKTQRNAPTIIPSMFDRRNVMTCVTREAC